MAALRVEQKLLAAALSSGSGECCRSPRAPPHRPHTCERTAFPLPHKHTRGTSSHAHLWDRALGGGSGAGASSEAPLSTLHTFRGSISRSFIHTYTPPLDTCRRLRGGPALFQTFDWGGVFLRGFFVPAYIRFQRFDFQHRSVCLRTYVSHTLPPPVPHLHPHARPCLPEHRARFLRSQALLARCVCFGCSGCAQL